MFKGKSHPAILQINNIKRNVPNKLSRKLLKDKLKHTAKTYISTRENMIKQHTQNASSIFEREGNKRETLREPLEKTDLPLPQSMLSVLAGNLLKKLSGTDGSL